MIADEPDFIRLADLGVEAVEGDACAPSTDVLVGSLRTPEGRPSKNRSSLICVPLIGAT
jgi:hypothetical protein